MDDLFNSAAFQEFLQKRCEEIIEDDKVCQDINKELLALEKELLPTLSEESLKKVLKIDALTQRLIAHIPVICTEKFTIITKNLR
jgi:hypothetical protein